MFPDITFHDITSTEGTWAPNSWKTRYALNFKKIPYKTHWLEYPNIAGFAQSIGAKPTGMIPFTASPQFTCPMISAVLPGDDKATTISDSGDIADFLDAHPALNGADTPRLFPAGTRELQDAFLAANVVGGMVTPGYVMLSASAGAGKLHPVSEEYFRRTRKEWHGGDVEWLGERAAQQKIPLDEWVPMGSEYRKQAWEQVKAGWGRAAKAFKETQQDGHSPWLTGETPVYADLVLLAWITTLKQTATEEEWAGVLEWDDGLWKALWEAGGPFRVKI
ncbi:hypothetical protein BKA62DRAFT_711830, partial [Auriculariales sp. MPI-PUGE-AT-0066]